MTEGMLVCVLTVMLLLESSSGFPLMSMSSVPVRSVLVPVSILTPAGPQRYLMQLNAPFNQGTQQHALHTYVQVPGTHTQMFNPTIQNGNTHSQTLDPSFHNGNTHAQTVNAHSETANAHTLQRLDMGTQETKTGSQGMLNQLLDTHTLETLAHTPGSPPENGAQVMYPGLQDPESQVLLPVTAPPVFGSATPGPLQPDPQGQILNVWTDPVSVPLFPAVNPGVTDQMFFPVWSLPGPSAGQNTQPQVNFPMLTTSIIGNIGLQSDSESSEEGAIPPVIYMLPVSAEMPNAGLSDQGQVAPDGPESLLPPSGPTDPPTFAHLGGAAPTTLTSEARRPSPGATDLGANAPSLPVGVQQETRVVGGGAKEGGNPCAPATPNISTRRETSGGTESPTLTLTAPRGDQA